ncbi:MAG TPA: hypothetical protein VLA88_00685 [Candidatus Saccharimonadales bacterium]|nr:hypothetical protein [Candidatus Saccharimonadales bacterium]
MQNLGIEPRKAPTSALPIATSKHATRPGYRLPTHSTAATNRNARSIDGTLLTRRRARLKTRSAYTSLVLASTIAAGKTPTATHLSSSLGGGTLRDASMRTVMTAP